MVLVIKKEPNPEYELLLTVYQAEPTESLVPLLYSTDSELDLSCLNSLESVPSRVKVKANLWSDGSFTPTINEWRVQFRSIGGTSIKTINGACPIIKENNLSGRNEFDLELDLDSHPILINCCYRE